jgi:hypothetical protein
LTLKTKKRRRVIETFLPGGRLLKPWLSIRRDTSIPAGDYLKASQVEIFGKVLREKLLAKGSPFAKSYLNALVDEIVVEDKTATIKGSYAGLAETMQAIKKGNLNNQVPSFIPNWCAISDSNALPRFSVRREKHKELI